MFQIQAPIPIIPTADAKLVVGVHLQAAGLAAYREVALAAKGLEIAHLQFVFRGLTLAVSRASGATASSKSKWGSATRVCRRAPSPPHRCGRPRPHLGHGLARRGVDRRCACFDLSAEALCGASAGSSSRSASAFSRMRVDVAVDSRIAASAVCRPTQGL
jgi:hypothetical protein